jgi:oligosaccharide repeat unit polymerase
MALAASTALLIAIAIGARWMQGSWAAPGAFFCLIWLIAGVPAVIFLPDFVSPAAMLLITSFAVAILLGSLISARNTEASAVRADNRPNTGTPRLCAMTVALACAGFLASIGYVWDAGYSLTDLGSFSSWLELAVYYSGQRYGGEYVEPFVIRVLLAANYAGALLAGVLLGVSNRPLARAVGALPIVAAALITVLTTAKTQMLLSAVLFVSGITAHQVNTLWRRATLRPAWRLLATSIFLLGIGSVATVSLALRYGAEGSDATLLLTRIWGYLFGHMVALSAWLSVENWNQLQPTLGAFTFAGAYEVLGLTQRTAGFYGTIGLNQWAIESNVFTALRGMVLDFGFFGAWALALLIGMVSGHAYTRLRSATGGGVSLLCLATFYAFACWSPIVSVLAYNVVLLATVIAGVALIIASGELGPTPSRQGRAVARAGGA